MSYVLRLFVSSPSDVADARASVDDVVRDLNNIWGVQDGIYIQPLDWQNHVTPWMGKKPQPNIFDQLPLNTWDLMVGILWSRFGTPTGSTDPNTGAAFQSGTEEEFTLAYNSLIATGRPRILFYRCMKPVSPDVDTAQLRKVQDFFKKIEKGRRFTGMYARYNTPDEFRQMLRQHLERALRDFRASL